MATEQAARTAVAPARAGPRSRNGRGPLLWTAAIFLLHGIALTTLFEPPQGIFNAAPLLDQDWGLHFHHLESLEKFWRADRRLWGYNPFFMAGYPSNTIQDLSIKFFEFAALLLSALGLTSLHWFKILTFLSAAAVPWPMYFAARNCFEQRHATAVVAALLGSAYWWNSMPREMFFYGMVGFPAASYLTVFGVSAFYRIAARAPAWDAAVPAWWIFVLALPALHVQSTLILLPPILALLVYRPSLCSRRLLLWCAVAGALSLLANWVWLACAWSHRGDDVSSRIVDQLPLFLSRDPLTFLRDYLGPENYWSFRGFYWEKGPRLALLVLGGLGLGRLLRGPRAEVGVMLLGALAALFAVTYFGSLIPALRGWQPLRFKVPFDLFLVLPAAFVLSHGWAEGRSVASRCALAVVSAFGAVAFVANVGTTEFDGRMRLRTEIRPEVRAVVQWIADETPADGRVLFEESGDETGFVYDGMYLSSFLPHLAGRELIGGPINLYNDRHHFAEFHSGRLFGRAIQRLTDKEIRSYFRLYNIGAVVAFHPDSVQRLQRVAGLVTVDRRSGPIHLMKVNQPLSWLVQGTGTVRAKLNRIEVAGAEGREMILKYHWVKGLVATPPTRIAPVMLLDDPIPFVRVIDPPEEFALSVEE